MVKFNAQNLLLATTALCTVSIFSNNANATYVPTRTFGPAYSVRAGTLSQHNLKFLSGYNSNNEPIYEYYEYTLVNNAWKADGRVNDDPNKVANNGVYGKSYLNFNYTQQTSDAIAGAIYNSKTLGSGFVKGDFIGNYTRAVAYPGCAYGGAIYNAGNIANIYGDFLMNHTEAYKFAAGGAIYNKEGSTIGDITSHFVGNYTYSRNYSVLGGAIFNLGDITSITGNFINNYAQTYYKDTVAGGAIYNSAYFDNDSGKYLSNVIGKITGDFIGNYVKSGSKDMARGGAIFNQGGSIESLSGDFIGNYSITSNGGDTYGGAVYNNSSWWLVYFGGMITFVADADDTNYEDDILFQGNYVQKGSGAKQYEAIYNRGENSTITFRSNNNGSYTFYDYINGDNQANLNFTAETGTGVLNLYNDIKGQTKVNFTGNWNLDMRSAHNKETATPYNSITAKNISIESDKNLSVQIDINFDENKADSFYATTFGSGIITLDTINLIGDLSEGTVQIVYAPTNDLQLALGSAYSGETLLSHVVTEDIDEISTPLTWGETLASTTTSQDIYGKYALSTTYTDNDSITLSDIRSESSSTSTSIGDTLALLAHYDTEIVKNFNADPELGDENITYVLGSTQDEEFTGIGEMKGTLNVNGSENVDSILDLNGKTGFILAADATALNLNDVTVGGNTTIAQVTAAGKSINLHNAVINGDVTGTESYVMSIDGNNTLNGVITGANIVLNENTSGTLSLASDSAFSDVNLTVHQGIIDMVKDKIGDVTLRSLNILGNAIINVAVDLKNKLMDYITADSVDFAEGKTLSVAFTMLSGTDDNSVNVPFINVTGLTNIVPATETVEYDKMTYSVIFDAQKGEFVFSNPSPDTKGRKGGNKTVGASASVAMTSAGAVAGQTIDHGSTAIFSGMNSGDEPLGLSTWVKAFGANDDIELKHLSSKVDTQFYGLVGGIDSKRFVYENGTSAIYSVFGSYVRNKQKLDDVKIIGKIGYLGLSASLRNRAFSSNFTLMGGYMENEVNTPWGKDKFDARIFSVSNKTGIDIKKNIWTLTPALLLSYTGVDNEDYTAKSGTRVENKFMHIFAVSPELKIVGDFEQGWSSYAKASYNMFFYANNKVTADDVVMPATSIKPYVEYGLGLTKDWSKADKNAKDLNTFVEVNRHDGGRSGWDVNLGLKFDF